MKLSISNLSNNAWEVNNVSVPAYNVSEIVKNTKDEPIWLHFGAGNIFRGFIANLQQTLLNTGASNKGIIVAESYDHEIIDKMFTPFDNLVLNVALNPDSTTDYSIIGSIIESIKTNADGASRLVEIVKNPSLQFISFTITEKGYSLYDAKGMYLPAVSRNAENESHAMSIVAKLLHERYLTCKTPIALVSMDNLSKNGEKVRNNITEIINVWIKNGFVDDGFLSWIEMSVSFPWSMIDKITPSPAKYITERLTAMGIDDMDAIITEKKIFIAPFVNAEPTEYLVIEDNFPNGRPPLEKAGVFFTDRETVNKAERMKVCACLNPLHSAMAPFGCLLGFSLISEQMKDKDIMTLIKRISYSEGLPVAEDPGIINPEAFLNEVINTRFVNPFLPDSPWRIMVDHSQKVGVRFGETIKRYNEQDKNINELTAIPLAIAAWLRYLLAVDDSGKLFVPSADPLLSELQEKLRGIVWDDDSSYNGQAKEILRDIRIFGLDLTATPLSAQIEKFFIEMLKGVGAVRKVLSMSL